ncbi:MAG: caspase family protein [bacterium]
MARYGLLIGIDRYPFLPTQDLAGAGNDARLMHTLLSERFGFATGDLTLLLDEAASRAAIVAGLDALARRAGPGDEVLLYFAGRGGRVGFGPGGLDALIAADSGRGERPGRDVFSFEIKRFTQAVAARGAWPTVILDCCHAGTPLRDGDASVRQAPLDPRDLGDVLAALDLKAPAEAPTWAGTCLVACEPDGLAPEGHEPAADRVHGVMTWQLVRALAGLAGPATWQGVLQTVAPRVALAVLRQRVSLLSGADRHVFSAESVPPRATLPANMRRLRVALNIPAERAGDREGLVAQCQTLRPSLEVLAQSDRSRADVVVHLLSPREASWDAPCPALGALEAWTWAVVGLDGRLIVEPLPLSGDLGPLVRDLGALARYRTALESPPPEEATHLKAGVSLEIRVRSSNGTEFDPGEPGRSASPGDQVTYRIHNRSAKVVYITLLEFDSDLQVAVLRQTLKGKSVAVEPSSTHVVEGNSLALPERRLPAAEPGEIQRSAMAHLRLVVTEERTSVVAASMQPSPPMPYAVLERGLELKMSGREISPATGGKVLFYNIKSGSTLLGQLAVTSETSTTRPNTGYWSWRPSKGTESFSLIPGVEKPESEALPALIGGQGGFVPLGNGRFPSGSEVPSVPAGALFWKISDDTGVVAYMAVVGDQLRWFRQASGDYLPKKTLTFSPISASSFPSGPMHVAIDKPR